MSRAALAADPAARIKTLLEQRTETNRAFFEAESGSLARLCHSMAERFARGGRLIALGSCAAARSDAHHVAVEFVHPVIVGKRALPAIALTGEGPELAGALELLGKSEDIVIGFGTEERAAEMAAALQLARERDCLTVAFSRSVHSQHTFDPPTADPFIRQELIETLYHVLWELVHVFFEHRGLLSGREPRRIHDAGASSFLYPFLAEQESELEPVLDDVRSSIMMKAEETAQLRAQTLTENLQVLLAAAASLQASFEQGGKLLALGNGGSATDAMDVVADFRSPHGAARGRAAIDLTDDPSILTAIANDIGTDAIFARQVIAYGSPGDGLLAFSTSGNSENVIAALAEARRRGLRTISLVGYDGGRVAAEGLADQVVVTRSEHIPRIQEAQASAYHVLRELVR